MVKCLKFNREKDDLSYAVIFIYFCKGTNIGLTHFSNTTQRAEARHATKAQNAMNYKDKQYLMYFLWPKLVATRMRKLMCGRGRSPGNNFKIDKTQSLTSDPLLFPLRILGSSICNSDIFTCVFCYTDYVTVKQMCVRARSNCCSIITCRDLIRILCVLLIVGSQFFEGNFTCSRSYKSSGCTCDDWLIFKLSNLCTNDLKVWFDIWLCVNVLCDEFKSTLFIKYQGIWVKLPSSGSVTKLLWRLSFCIMRTS